MQSPGNLTISRREEISESRGQPRLRMSAAAMGWWLMQSDVVAAQHYLADREALGKTAGHYLRATPAGEPSVVDDAVDPEEEVMTYSPECAAPEFCGP